MLSKNTMIKMIIEQHESSVPDCICIITKKKFFRAAKGNFQKLSFTVV